MDMKGNGFHLILCVKNAREKPYVPCLRLWNSERDQCDKALCEGGGKDLERPLKNLVLKCISTFLKPGHRDTGTSLSLAAPSSCKTLVWLPEASDYIWST